MDQQFSIHFLKAAVINIFKLTTDQITMFKVKGAAHSDNPTEYFQPALQFSSALGRLVAFLESLCATCPAPNCKYLDIKSTI